MDSRQRKGLQILGRSRIEKRGDYWLVPSQTTSGIVYLVRFGPDENSCSCPDFEVNLEKIWCKHILAVQGLLKEQGTLPKHTPRRPAFEKFPRDWRPYNEAKANEPQKFRELLRDLARCLPNHEPGRKGGRPRVPVRDMVFAAGLKTYERKSGRNLDYYLKQEHDAGFITQIPKASTILNFFGAPDTADILRTLIAQSGKPLKGIETTFPIDSTNFRIPRIDKWYDEDLDDAVERKSTVKAHICSGLLTNIITWAKVTHEDSHDSIHFPELLAKTAERFRVLETMADAAYGSNENYSVADKIGATAYLAFKKGSTGWRGGHFQKMYHFYQLRRDEFKKRYNLRANAESTHSMLKRRFDGMLDSKKNEAIENEILCMVLVHNICVVIQSSFCLGVEAEFWDDTLRHNSQP